MSDDQTALGAQALGNDIAFLRALAEEGRSGPLGGGSILVAGGLLFGTASLVSAYGYAQNAPWAQLVWPISGVAFMAFLFRAKNRQVLAGPAARAAAAAWSGLGWAMFAILLSLGIVAIRTGDGRMTLAICPVMLALYGSGWFVAALVSRVRWLGVVAAATFAMTLVCAWFASSGWVSYVIYGASLYGLVALPGYVLMRKARAAA